MNIYNNGKIFEIINVDSKEMLDKFIDGLTPEQAIYCLTEAAKCSFTRGAYTLGEAELVAKALRVLEMNPQNIVKEPITNSGV